MVPKALGGAESGDSTFKVVLRKEIALSIDYVIAMQTGNQISK